MNLRLDLRMTLDRFELRVDLQAIGPVTGVFGRSGAGKSSLLEAVAGLRPSARGTIRLGNTTWLDSAAGIQLPPERRNVGYVPQHGLLFPHLDVRGNLLAGARRARAAGVDVPGLLRRVAALLELEPLLSRDPTTLSGGERQRVALGRALCSAPDLLLLDEPLSALDLPLRRRLLTVLRRVREELTVAGHAIPMLFISHDPTEAQALCDELVVLRDGAVIAHGEPRKVLTDPRVYALAGEEGFENVLPARVEGHEGGTSVLRLGGSKEHDTGVTIRTFRAQQSKGDEIYLGLPSNEILIATERPSGISARNILPATVTEVHSVDGRRLVSARLSGDVPDLAVEVTEVTPGELGLEPGRRIYLVIKAASCRIYGQEPP